MNSRKPTLTDSDHKNMDIFLGHVLDDFKSGALSKGAAVSGLAHVMAAIDKGNYGEAVNWLQQGRKLIRMNDNVSPPTGPGEQ